MFATDFLFDGELASSHGLMICSFDGSSGISSVRNGADVTLTTVKVPGSNIWNHVYSGYTEVLSTTFQLMRMACNSDDDIYFSVEEQRSINRWLNRLDKFYPFKLVQDGYEHIFFNAQMNVNKIEYAGKVIGFEVTLTTDKPYAYYEEDLIVFTLNKIKNKYSIVCMSDINQNCETEVKIKCKKAGKVEIVNHINGTSTTFTTIEDDEIITMNNQKKFIGTSNTNREMEDLLDSFNFNWLSVTSTNEDSENIFELTTDNEVEISLFYYPVAKLGL